MSLTIGVSGNFRTGKDFFYTLLKQKLPNLIVERFSFADVLRYEIHEFIYEKFGFDIFSPTPEQKEMVRPIMVAYATAKRAQDEDYFIKKLAPNLLESAADIKTICDQRFENEYNFIKKLNGISVFIEKYTFKIDAMGSFKHFQPPANEFERENNKILKENADYIVTWEQCADINDKREIEEKCGSHINYFITWLKDSKYIN